MLELLAVVWQWVLWLIRVLWVRIRDPRSLIILVVVIAIAIAAYFLMGNPAVAASLKKFFTKTLPALWDEWVVKTLPKAWTAAKGYLIKKGLPLLGKSTVKHFLKTIGLTWIVYQLLVPAQHKKIREKFHRFTWYIQMYAWYIPRYYWVNAKDRTRTFFKLAGFGLLALGGIVLPTLHFLAVLVFDARWLLLIFKPVVLVFGLLWRFLIVPFGEKIAFGKLVAMVSNKLFPLLWRMLPTGAQKWRPFRAIRYHWMSRKRRVNLITRKKRDETKIRVQKKLVIARRRRAMKRLTRAERRAKKLALRRQRREQQLRKREQTDLLPKPQPEET